ncbi:MAG: butyrate kinase [Firmicutes bacterium]|nr:butyrate kinase [Bacillota bacterium]
MTYRVLTINPGSTSTKIAVFEDEREVLDQTLRHSAEELGRYESIAAQEDFRRQLVLDALAENGMTAGDLDAIGCRGGLIRPIPSGTYRVNETMVEDCRRGVQGEHASNLGALIGYGMGKEAGVPVFIVDPPSVDELSDVARISGHPLIRRTCIFHALNQKAVARQFAKEAGRSYEEMNLVVCHMGGGITVGAHVGGRVVDTQNAVGGEGPFTPGRSGGLPAIDVIRLCFDGEHTREELEEYLTSRGGLIAYTGTSSMREIQKRAKEEPEIRLLLDALLYQIAREIGAAAAAMKGKVDQIILTGGIANSEELMSELREQVEWIAPVTVYPGEEEMQSLAFGVLRVLRGEEEAKEYAEE